MKLAISPSYVFNTIIGFSLVSLSARVNPGYGFLGDWVIWMGFTIATLSLTRMHALGESKRNIPADRKWIRVIYRGIILLLMGFIAYRSHANTDFYEAVWSGLLLALNQSLLFGTFFDLWYNEFRGNDKYYHGDNSHYDRFAKKNPRLIVIIEFVGYGVTSFLVAYHIFI
jgi:hypothetical protein